MKIKFVVLTGLLIFGILSGESALQSAHASKPPIGWPDLPFIFGGTAIGMLFVIGLQILRSNPKYAQWAILFMSSASAYFLASGLSAVVIAGQISPASLLFVAMGSGATIGLLISWWLFKLRHLNKKRQSDA